jgi:hypothetical protein
MSDTAAEIRYYEKCLRQEARTIQIARVKLALLWLPATFGLSWAKEMVLDQRERIAHARYGIEDTVQDLLRLRKYGTVLMAYEFRDKSDGYDGWLGSDDQYQGGSQ